MLEGCTGERGTYCSHVICHVTGGISGRWVEAGVPAGFSRQIKRGVGLISADLTRTIRRIFTSVSELTRDHPPAPQIISADSQQDGDSQAPRLKSVQLLEISNLALVRKTLLKPVKLSITAERPYMFSS